jgi:glyoxylase-like metal-dependent hydrolase (beta-lactamase superfamily II)
VPERILLTHIHLDHAGATGTLAERWPDVEVWVHERGAPHLAAPEKLIKSATRLYGEHMDRLWGEIVPVPRERLRVLGEADTIGDWQAAYTPGHASHHVSYLHTPSGTAFCGDVAGVRVVPDGPVLAPTPPPDIDLALWRASIDLIAAWRPERLAITHFGDHTDVEGHLERLRAQLAQMAAWARSSATPARSPSGCAPRWPRRPTRRPPPPTSRACRPTSSSQAWSGRLRGVSSPR